MRLAPLPASPFRRVLRTLPFIAFLLGGCDRQEAPAARTIALAECRLPKVPLAARCGTLTVPEDRSRPDGRKITVAVAVLAANTLHPEPDPFVILAGGPGQAASQLGPFALQFSAIRRHRDIVLVDQRGTGRSSPLECAAFRNDPASPALELDPAPRATECAQELAAAGVDAGQYTTEAWIADLEAVRAALGYPRLNLWGGSYGTRAALEYVRRHPQRVRSVVLDGAAPPRLKINLDVWTTRDAALTEVLAACERSTSCRDAQPDLGTALTAIREYLGPAGRTLAMADPRTGAPRTIRFTMDHVIAAMQPLVYLPEYSSLLPELLRLAAGGDFAPLYAAATSLTGGLVEELNTALYYSVTCTEDVSRITPEERAAKLDRLRSRAIAELGLSACDTWPRGRPTPGRDQPVQTDIPVLLLSGGLDPVTPPANAEEVAKTLANSRHIVASGYGHNVSPHGCAPRLIAAFVAEAGFRTLPATCIHQLETSPRPPFWPSRLAPAP